MTAFPITELVCDRDRCYLTFSDYGRTAAVRRAARTREGWRSTRDGRDYCSAHADDADKPTEST